MKTIFCLFLLHFSLMASSQTISAGYGHTCAVKNGTVFCWGYNHYGQLGLGHEFDAEGPKPVKGLPSSVSQITGLSSHTCALVKDGAYCWGENIFGSLGNNSRTNSSKPVVPKGLGRGSGVTKIVAGDHYTCAIVRGGVQCWGWNRDCVIGKKGCLGGQASENDRQLVPRWVDGLGPNSEVTDLATGMSHTCAVVAGGLKCWGWGLYGKTGDGSGDDHYNPTPIDVIRMGPGSQVTGVSIGSRNTCAVIKQEVRCWGKGALIGVGDGSNDYEQPQLVLNKSYGVKSIASNVNNTCAIDSQNRAWCWGLNTQGQIGNGQSGLTKTALTPQRVLGITAPLLNLSVGASHSCAAVGNSFQCWGSNSFCKLGLTNCDQWSEVTRATDIMAFIGG